MDYFCSKSKTISRTRCKHGMSVLPRNISTCRSRPSKKRNHKITRKLRSYIGDAEYRREKLGLPDCQIAIRVDSLEEKFSCGIVSQERRYYLTSLEPSKVSPQKLLRLIRGHWQVENSLHWEKDRWWKIVMGRVVWDWQRCWHRLRMQHFPYRDCCRVRKQSYGRKRRKSKEIQTTL